VDRHESGQITHDAAEVYEDFFVSALFQQWAPVVTDAASIQAGQRVLDVACGTGVLARTVDGRVGPTGSVVGIDINDGMLAVARRKAPQIDWQRGRAEALPLPDARFDAVVSQFGLMFFEDRRAALCEMMRVLRRGGHLALAVWASLVDSPGYATLTNLLESLFGEHAAQALRAPFVLGDLGPLRRLLSESGLGDARIVTMSGIARFPSIASWLHTDIRGWTLSDVLDDEQFGRLLIEAERGLQPFTGSDGAVTFSAPAHIVTAVKA